MNRTVFHLVVLITLFDGNRRMFAADFLLDVDSRQVLVIPELSSGEPAAGKRVAVTPPEYAGSGVFHTVYLPTSWKRGGEPLPVFFEYTGNYFPSAGSTGRPEDAGLGFGLSGGQSIWVSLPYISDDGNENVVKWWGDTDATVAYAKRNVSRIIKDLGADPNAVFLCGFSRGAIGVNYIGLHDDQIARLWTAFITHDHFDGVRGWRNTAWGWPPDQYRAEATKRLRRVGNRPYLVSQNGTDRDTEDYVRSVLSGDNNFTFLSVNTEEILGAFPNTFAPAAHTDRWLLKPSRYRTAAWAWINGVAIGEK
jgi:hypothetical protein